MRFRVFALHMEEPGCGNPKGKHTSAYLNIHGADSGRSKRGDLGGITLPPPPLPPKKTLLNPNPPCQRSSTNFRNCATDTNTDGDGPVRGGGATLATPQPAHSQFCAIICKPTFLLPSLSVGFSGWSRHLNQKSWI